MKRVLVALGGLLLVSTLTQAEAPPQSGSHPGGGGTPTGPIHARAAVAPLYPACHESPTPTAPMYPFNYFKQYDGTTCDLDPVAPPSLPGSRNVVSIFLGRSWNDSTFAGDRMEGIDGFFAGWNRSAYSRVLMQYETPEKGKLRQPLSVQYTGHRIDSIPDRVLRDANRSGTLDAVVLEEVCAAVSNGLLPINENGKGDPWHVFAYPSAHRPITVPSCGFREYVNCPMPDGNNSSTFTLSIIYDAAHDHQCDVRDNVTGHSQGLASIANSSAAMLADDFNDWQWSGWYDAQMQEVADKCAWQFNDDSVRFSNGTYWKLQALWSNVDYSAGTGSPGLWGLPGCVDKPVVQILPGGR